MKKTLTILGLLLLPSLCFGADYRERRDDSNVLTGYIRTSDGASIPLATGNSDYQAVLIWLQSNTADPDTSVLAQVKRKKISELKREALTRIAVDMPEWDDMEKIKFIASIWNMLGTPNASQTAAKDTYVYAKNTVIPWVNGLTTVTAVQDVDVVNDPSWP